MLLLTRKVGEWIDIIDSKTDRVICAVNVAALLPNNVVRLGFIAEADITIIRDNAKTRRSKENGEVSTPDIDGNR